MCIVASCSEAGGHPTNEDAFVVMRHPGEQSCWIVRSRMVRVARPVAARPRDWRARS